MSVVKATLWSRKLQIRSPTSFCSLGPISWYSFKETPLLVGAETTKTVLNWVVELDGLKIPWCGMKSSLLKWVPCDQTWNSLPWNQNIAYDTARRDQNGAPSKVNAWTPKNWRIMFSSLSWLETKNDEPCWKQSRSTKWTGIGRRSSYKPTNSFSSENMIVIIGS